MRGTDKREFIHRLDSRSFNPLPCHCFLLVRVSHFLCPARPFGARIPGDVQEGRNVWEFLLILGCAFSVSWERIHRHSSLRMDIYRIDSWEFLRSKDVMEERKKERKNQRGWEERERIKEKQTLSLCVTIIPIHPPKYGRKKESKVMMQWRRRRKTEKSWW